LHTRKFQFNWDMKSTKWSSHTLVFLKDHTGEMCCSRKYAYFHYEKCLDLTSPPFNTPLNSTLALCLPCTWLLGPNTPCPWRLETSHGEGIVNFWHSGHCQFTVTVTNVWGTEAFQISEEMSFYNFVLHTFYSYLATPQVLSAHYSNMAAKLFPFRFNQWKRFANFTVNI